MEAMAALAWLLFGLCAHVVLSYNPYQGQLFYFFNCVACHFRKVFLIARTLQDLHAQIPFH